MDINKNPQPIWPVEADDKKVGLYEFIKQEYPVQLTNRLETSKPINSVGPDVTDPGDQQATDE